MHNFIEKLTVIEELTDTRQQWKAMHWILDVTFKEDANTAIDKTAVMNQNIIRKRALAILKRIDTILAKKYSLKGTLCDEFGPLRCFGSSFGNITLIISNPDASVGAQRSTFRTVCSHKVVTVGFNTLCYDAERRGIKPSARINMFQKMLFRLSKDCKPNTSNSVTFYAVFGKV